jgi:hypothetical protein
MREEEIVVFFDLLKTVNAWGEFVECDSFLSDGRLCEFQNNKKSPYKIIIYPTYVILENNNGEKECKSFADTLNILVHTWYDDFTKTYCTILVKKINALLGQYEILDKISFDRIGTLTHSIDGITTIQVKLDGFVFYKEVSTNWNRIEDCLRELSSQYYKYKNYVREN